MSSRIPDLDLARIRRYAEYRVPEHARHQVRNEITVRGGTVTIVERRAPWRPEEDSEWTSYPVAQRRWNTSAATWTLYWRDRHTRWHPYPDTPATPDLNELLAEIERNKTGAFWG